jgi:hypothetical protein
VSHFALTSQGILTKCVHGVTFKGSRTDERHDWRWTPTTNQDVNDSTQLCISELLMGSWQPSSWRDAAWLLQSSWGLLHCRACEQLGASCVGAGEQLTAIWGEVHAVHGVRSQEQPPPPSP